MCAAGRVRASVRIWFLLEYNRNMRQSRVRASFNLTESNIRTKKKKLYLRIWPCSCVDAVSCAIFRLAHKAACIPGHVQEAVTSGGPLLVRPGLCCILLRYKKRITTVAWKVSLSLIKLNILFRFRLNYSFCYNFICLRTVCWLTIQLHVTLSLTERAFSICWFFFFTVIWPIVFSSCTHTTEKIPLLTFCEKHTLLWISK